jgi:hypothetical protein
MTAYAIAFGRREKRLYLTENRVPQAPERSGWQRYVWTTDRKDAELFGSEDSARKFAAANLNHALFEVVVVPPTGLPTGDLGGTPAAIRLAA